MTLTPLRQRTRSLVLVLLSMIFVGMPIAAMQPGSPEAYIQAASPADQSIITRITGARFGDAVAISDDVFAASSIYAPVENVAAGQVYLYERDPQAANGWKEIRTLQREVPHNLGAFGEALALQNGTLIIGVPRDPRDDGLFWQGAVYVYERNHGGSNVWGLLTQLHDEVGGRFRQFGSAVALDGDLVAVGVQGADDNQGKVFLYSRAAGWARIATIAHPEGQPGDEFGSAVAIKGDTLVVGARYGDANSSSTNSGVAYVFDRNLGGTNAWGMVAKLIADVPDVDSSFGDSLVLDSDTIAISAYNEDIVENGQKLATQVGATYVYERNLGGANAWGMAAALRPPDGHTLDFYGRGLALSGDRLWVGAPNSKVGGFDQQGILYSYQRNQGGAGSWGALPLIEANSGSKDHEFGTSMAVDSGTLIASAPNYAQIGAVYVMDVTNTTDTSISTVFMPIVIHEAILPTGLLLDGSSLEGINGAILGAVPGTLHAPVEATIASVSQPSTPLPAGFSQRGDYYRISARTLTIAPADKPLLVGIPVPDTANTLKLAVAAFMPDGYASGELKSETTTRSWVELPGSYDTTTKLFVTTVRTLLPEGVTLVLFEHPNNQPLPPAETMQIQQNAMVEYAVSCAPASSSQDACTPDNYTLLATELEAAHALFVNTHSFKPPALVHLAGIFIGADKSPQLKEVYYNAVVRTAPCIDRAGETFAGNYHYVTMRLVVCMDAQDTADNIRKTVRHELFHAIQATYSNVADDYFTSETSNLTIWTLEGTAAAAEGSSFLMLRSPNFLLREASKPLTSTAELHEYSSQDFWVYTGLEGEQTNHYIEYLKPIFEEGATPEHVNQAIPLGNAYWEWAKNQVIEHHQPMIDAFINGACQLENRTIDPASTKFLFFPSQSRVEGTLPPLTSALVQIEVQPAVGNLLVLATNNTNQQDLRYKVYGADEAGCGSIPDGRRTLFNVPAESTIFVLVSNVSLSEDFDFVVEAD